jgi:hypothetical protein
VRWVPLPSLAITNTAPLAVSFSSRHSAIRRIVVVALVVISLIVV